MGKVGSGDQKIKSYNRIATLISEHKKKFSILCVFILVFVVFLIANIFFSGKSNINTAYSVCEQGSNANILKQSVPEINQNRVSELQKSVAQIQKLSNYEKDPNCLYVVVSYYMITENLTKASYYLNELNSVYNPKIGYSKLLGNETESPKYLSDKLKYLEVAVPNLERDEKELSGR